MFDIYSVVLISKIKQIIYWSIYCQILYLQKQMGKKLTQVVENALLYSSYFLLF